MSAKKEVVLRLAHGMCWETSSLVIDHAADEVLRCSGKSGGVDQSMHVPRASTDGARERLAPERGREVGVKGRGSGTAVKHKATRNRPNCGKSQPRSLNLF